jgi:hypothetical protein
MNVIKMIIQMPNNQPIRAEGSIVQHIRESFTTLDFPCPTRAVMRGTEGRETTNNIF